MAIGAAAASGQVGEDGPAWDRSPAVEQRVETLLGQLTTAEKVDLATGETNNFYGFYNNPIARLGIPALQMADGPAGVRIADPNVNEQRSTELPAPVSLAATWDLRRADRYGDLLGDEARRTKHNVVLGPGLDIQRSAQGARNFESFSEDPLLTGAFGTAVTQGIQRHAVMATAKHFLLNNAETDRFAVDVQADERAIREIYLRPWEDVVRDGHLGSAMCAFNKVNGAFACENAPLLELLKQQLDFRGFVMSDYGATKSTAPAANAGLDQEQPGCGAPTTGGSGSGSGGGDACMFGPKLLAAVQAGDVSQARLDDMVRRILRPLIGLGLFENPPTVSALPERSHGRFARETARQGIVLLKNDDGALPLRGADRPRSIAVIGADANTASAQGGGSSVIKPTYTVSPLEGIRRRAGAGATVTWAPGTDPIDASALLPGAPPVPSSVLSPAGDPAAQGLRGEYWDNPTRTGDPVAVQTDPRAAVNLGFYNFPGFYAGSANLPRLPTSLNTRMSARWTGTFTAPASGDYELSVTSAGTSRVVLDGEVILQTGAAVSRPGEFTIDTATLSLQEGEAHDVLIEYAADAPKQDVFVTGGQFRFGWRHPEEATVSSIRTAADLAGEADAAIVVARDYNGEGFEDKPDLRLPNEQDELIREVAAANPRTVVVLTTGNPVATADWQDRVGAIVEAWYPGQEQGNAIADVLFGDVNPSGKLPITFPRSEEETPISGSPEQFPGRNGILRYGEGVFVGYRGYDQAGLEPEFPFGYGLSYTRYRYSGGVRVTRSGGELQATFSVSNTGRRTGTEIAQVYAGRLPTATATPPRQLAGWARVRLDPGETEEVTVTLDRRSLSYWDSATHRWTMPSGRVAIFVGASSRDIRLTGAATLP
jgi:beta-glucosidase